MLDRLERKIGRWAIPHLILYIVGGQLAAFVLSIARPEFLDALYLVPNRVLEGEVWRLITFMFLPADRSPVWALFAIYFNYMVGQALEAHWGAFRFNTYTFIAWMGTAVAAFATPAYPATNFYVMMSMFLAFTYLFPDVVLRVAFILPVKARWLGWFAWLVVAGKAFIGDTPEKIDAAAGVANFFLFFGHDIYLRARGFGRKRIKRVENARRTEEARHVCAVCGITDTDNPSMQFRYCSKCKVKRAYCSEHLRAHEHVEA